MRTAGGAGGMGGAGFGGMPDVGALARQYWQAMTDAMRSAGAPAAPADPWRAALDGWSRLAGGHDGLHGLRRGADVVPAICVQGDGISPLRDLPQLGQRQLARCQGKHAIHSRMAGRVRPCSRAQASACS